ncbi:ECF RNA polymerase sigma factor EcfG [Sulfitobacter sp. DSM 110093]|uniref:RNA polymerase sigma factor n=1 Tax=Sulfitobacter sp. DSM 110093 TaxID=2883127 RepID=UPI001FABA903|nr:sigma-70 family RNA polymerase sigma factor [Sulfitobacter sp. DSM 110093]UOA31766.1 ECF RNA polymerase sigma factor EcfG [Sulfitobacter sp. DSM 110093]
MTSDTKDPLTPLWPRLSARARRLSNTAEEADDLMQETAMKLMQTLRDGTVIETPDRYAMITLHNLARQRWRQKRETEELADDMALTPPAAPARLACADLRDAIARLPPEQLTLMQLVQDGESSPQALAIQTGLPLGTVMSRLSRARTRLRAEMDMAADTSVKELM